MNILEYAEAIQNVEDNVSTDYCKCIHNNIGWCGFYIHTPNNKYCIVSHGDIFSGEYYTINKYTDGFGSYPAQLIKDKFNSLEAALIYLENNNM